MESARFLFKQVCGKYYSYRKKKHKKGESVNGKVYIIGLDGARFDVIKKWTEKGKLPAFKKIIKNGCSGNLRTVYPPHSMPGWTSFMTGTNPGKHGIYGTQMQKDDSYDFTIPNSTYIREPENHQILSAYGKTVGIINIPMTYPPKKVNGVLVSSWLTPPSATFTYPKDLMKKINEIGYLVQPLATRKSKKGFRAGLSYVLKKRFELMNWVMEKYQCDFIVNVITETEHMHHNYASFLEKEHPNYKPEYEEKVLSLYKEVDRKLGELIEKISDDTTLLIVSDHGFGPCWGHVHLNSLLEKNNYFVSAKRRRTLTEKLVHWVIRTGLRSTIQKMINKIHLKIPKLIERKLREAATQKIDADWDKTKAYCAGKFGEIRINLKGREPKGIVEMKDYERIRNEIIELIESDTELKKIVKKVHKKENIFNGTFVEKMPDLYVEFNKPYKTSIELSNELISKNEGDIEGTHTMEGTFIAYGKEIKKGTTIKNASLVDITPTTLHAMGLPVLKSMDGKVLKIFKKNSSLSKKPKFATKEELGLKSNKGKELKEEDNQKVMETLKGMGYL